MKNHKLHLGHLGDRWAHASYIIYKTPEDELTVFHNKPNLLKCYEETFNLLDHNKKITYTTNYPSESISTGKATYLVNHKYIPTKIKWEPKKYNKITYNFDCGSFVKEKTPPNINDLMKFNFNKQIVKVGLPMNLENTIKELATSDLYIGLDQGVSHVARSIGVPTIIIEYNWFPSSFDEYVKIKGIKSPMEIMHPKEFWNYNIIKWISNEDAFNKIKQL